MIGMGQLFGHNVLWEKRGTFFDKAKKRKLTLIKQIEEK